jgi:cyclase
MQRERLTDDIYIFTSDLYAQATAAVIVTTEGAVVFDTLVYPEETRAIKRFVENRLGIQVRYVLNSHFHADHTTGTCLFDGATVIAHARCRTLLDTRGRESMERAKAASQEMQDIVLRLPDFTFDDGSMTFYFGKKTFHLWATPGHSPDSIVCHVKEDNVLFAADTLMPIPYFVDGSYDDFLNSLAALRGSTYEHIVQGHGEVILRGEIEEKIESDIEYLLKLKKAVDAALAANRAVENIDIESCGKSRILLNGTVQQLHRQNALTLAAQRREIMQLS